MQGLPVSLSPGSDVMIERKKASELLDAVLEAMGPDTRAVFVFFEIEKLPPLESTRLLEVPIDTVATRLRRARTRLRRARADFQARIQELERRTTEIRGPTEESFDERSAPTSVQCKRVPARSGQAVEPRWREHGPDHSRIRAI